MAAAPMLIILFSGKRKSGKDYVTNRLLDKLKDHLEKIAVVKITGPIKQHFAEIKNLSFDELMGSGEYKEKIRKEMIDWSEEERGKDPGVFCKLALEMYKAYGKHVWIVSDTRRKTDILWFKKSFGDSVKCVRIETDNHTRKDRGFVFKDGVDNVKSECDLDDFKEWDCVINNSNCDDIDTEINHIYELICRYV